MSHRRNLRVGMDIAEACQALAGWRCRDVQVADEARQTLAWDFVRPNGAAAVRLLFDDLRLCSWHALLAPRG